LKEEILEHINQLEKDQSIKILLAVESGSRAWGCPSPDSDYDIRIIFKRSESEYLEIDDKPDTIDYFHGELLDINGWDIKKTLKLIRKSNATPFEWSQSPIIYKEVDNFSKILLGICKSYFQGYHSVNHYKGIAKNSYSRDKNNSSLKLKKLFYVLRPIMAAKWILEKNEIPPMDIPNLIQIIKDKSIVDHIKMLLEIKSKVNEDYVYKPDPIITNYIDSQFEHLSTVKIENNPLETNSDLLNKTFKNIIAD